MTTLNHRHNYGLDLFLLAVDEGISVDILERLFYSLFFELFLLNSPSSQRFLFIISLLL